MSQLDDFLVVGKRLVNPLVSRHNFSIEVGQILNDGLEKVGSVGLEFFAEFDQISKIKLVQLQLAQFVRVVVLDSCEQRLFVQNF